MIEINISIDSWSGFVAWATVIVVAYVIHDYLRGFIDGWFHRD